ncbi:MAG: hypothetical protein FJW92_00020 [Actinobacteria bacterium]|nr:hypothetical protein [Actinomycetota bacterium]
MSDQPPESGPRGDFSTSCEVDTPRERVFAAYTDAAAIPHFWAPEGVEIPPDSVDLEPVPGGAFNMVMKVGGDDYPMTGSFAEVVTPEYVSFHEPGLGIRCVISFDDIGDGRTRVTVLQTNVPEEFRGENAEMGFQSSFRRLAAYLAGESG